VKPLPRHALAESLPEPVRAEDPRHLCPLCGYRFLAGRLACPACGPLGGCDALGCPHCGHKTPAESVTVNWARRLFRRLLGLSSPPGPPERRP